MDKKCAVFVGGDEVSADAVDMQFVERSTVYGADKGYCLAEKLGIECDIVIGDFDSSPRPDRSNVITFPVEKDDSDLSLVLNHALENGLVDFQIYGALGGSADHMFANIASLYFLVKRGAKGVIIGDNDRLTLLSPGEYRFEKREGCSLSLFAFNSIVTGLSVSGAKYKAKRITLTPELYSLGLSNSVTDDKGADVSFDSGYLLVIESRR